MALTRHVAVGDSVVHVWERELFALSLESRRLKMYR